MLGDKFPMYFTMMRNDQLPFYWTISCKHRQETAVFLYSSTQNYGQIQDSMKQQFWNKLRAIYLVIN